MTAPRFLRLYIYLIMLTFSYLLFSLEKKIQSSKPNWTSFEVRNIPLLTSAVAPPLISTNILLVMKETESFYSRWKGYTARYISYHYEQADDLLTWPSSPISSFNFKLWLDKKPLFESVSIQITSLEITYFYSNNVLEFLI